MKAIEVPVGSPVFLDASALVAMTHGKDRWHAPAVGTLQALVARRCTFITLRMNLYEAMTAVNTYRPHRPDWVPAEGVTNPLPADLLRLCRQVGLLLRDLPAHLGWFPPQLVVQADRLRRSAFDYAAFVQIQREGIAAVVAFDRHFDQAAPEFGFSVVREP